VAQEEAALMRGTLLIYSPNGSLTKRLVGDRAFMEAL
jgi:hypothetical protein